MTDVDSVRLLVPDTGTPQIFSDTDLQTFLDINDDNIYWAAAQAVEVIATGLVMDGSAATVRTDDLSVSDKDSVNALFKRASDLRIQGTLLSNDAFEIVYPFAETDTETVELWPWAD